MKSKFLPIAVFLVVAVTLVLSSTGWAHEHEHASNLPIHVSWGLEGLKEVANVHPLFVHFPIALLLMSAALYFLGSILRKEDLFIAAKWELYFGTLSAALAVATGYYAANRVPHNEQTHAIMMAHQYFGFMVLGLSLVLSAWVFLSKRNVPPRKGRIVFLLGLVLLALGLTQGADLGGRLVFLHGVGIREKGASKSLQAMTKSPAEAEATHEHAGHEH